MQCDAMSCNVMQCKVKESSLVVADYLVRVSLQGRFGNVGV